MTFAEMKAETFRRLRESSSAPIYFTEAEIETALNDGYAELSDATEWYENHLDIDLLNNRPYYDLRAVVGDTFLAIGPAFDVQTNRWLESTPVRILDAHDRRWERVTGEPHRLLTRGLWWLGYWPRIQSQTGVITQYYKGLPPPLVEDDDEPGFPEAFHEGCIEFAEADLWAQDAESDRALAAWAAYVETEAGLLAWVDGRTSSAAIHGVGVQSVPR